MPGTETASVGTGALSDSRHNHKPYWFRLPASPSDRDIIVTSGGQAHRHTHGSITGGVNPKAFQAAAFRSITAPFLMFARFGMVSCSWQITAFPPTVTSTRVPAGFVRCCQSSGGRAHMGMLAVVSAPHLPMPLSP